MLKAIQNETLKLQNEATIVSQYGIVIFQKHNRKMNKIYQNQSMMSYNLNQDFITSHICGQTDAKIATFTFVDANHLPKKYQITLLCFFAGITGFSLQPIKSLCLCDCTCRHQIYPSSLHSQVSNPLKFGPKGLLLDPTLEYKYEC